MRRASWIVMASVGLALGFASPGAAASDLKKATIVIGSPGLIYTLHYVAEEAGLFKAEGLAVETIEVASGPRQVAAVQGGSADVAPTNMEHIVRLFAEGGDMIAVSRIFDVSPYVLVLSNAAIAKAGIQDGMSIDDKVKRLHGLKIAVTTVGSGTDSFLRSLFLKRGATPDEEVAIEPLGSPGAMLAAMERGIIDGFSFLAPFSEIPAQKGYGKVVIDPITGELPELKNVPYLVVTTTRDTYEKKRPLMLAIQRAYARAMKLVHDNPDEARGYVRKHLSEADELIFNATFNRYLTAIPDSPVITHDQVESMIRWMNISAPSPLRVTYDDIIVSDLASEASKGVLGK
jgi:NitT/TauT family transport system substrate-binding protein